MGASDLPEQPMPRAPQPGRQRAVTRRGGPGKAGPTKEHRRIRREARTVAAMVGIYCQGHHDTAGGHLCGECQALLDYALLRLSRCPFQEAKTTCAKCPVHCYAPVRREQIRAVMRYAGPRMLLRHPLLALMHLIDGITNR